MSDPRISAPSLPDSTERATLPGRSPTGLPPVSHDAPPPPGPGTAMRIGFEASIARLRSRATSLTVVLGAALVAVSALIERRVTVADAVDRSLTATFTLVVPLASFALTAQALGRTRLANAVWSAARYGVARRDVALGSIAAASLASAGFSALFAVLAVLLGGAGTAGIAGDAFTSAWIAALTGAAYTGWFALGATFGRHGGGRFLPLLLDFAIGGTTGIAGALLPRANARSLLGLLGGQAPLHLTQASSSVILGAAALLLGGLAALRCRE